MKRLLTLSCCLLLTAACTPEVKTVRPGRGGAEMERGPEVIVHPKGADPLVARHGLWQGLDAQENRCWEVRYTRGHPTGAYREWNAEGDMVATWPYNWDGQVEGWARWFENGEPVYKREISAETQPDFDPIGSAAAFREWAEAQPDDPVEPANP